MDNQASITVKSSVKSDGGVLTLMQTSHEENIKKMINKFIKEVKDDVAKNMKELTKKLD